MKPWQMMRGFGQPASGGGFPDEAGIWEGRINALGGSVTSGERAIADALIAAIQSASYGSKIIYLLPFIGASIAAHRVPLRDKLNVGAATNGGGSPFTDSDCDTSTGLVNSTEKAAYLDTGITPSQLGTSNNGGLGWYERDFGAGSNVEPMGTYAATNSPDQRFVLDLRSTIQAFRWGASGNAAIASGAASNGHYYGQRSSSTLRRIYKNGAALLGSSTASDSASRASERTIVVHGCRESNSSGNYFTPWKGRGGCAYMTDGTLSDADVADFHSLLNTYLITPTGR